MVALQLTGNVANDDLDEYINMKKKNEGIGQRSVTLHIEDFRNDTDAQNVALVEPLVCCYLMACMM